MLLKSPDYNPVFWITLVSFSNVIRWHKHYLHTVLKLILLRRHVLTQIWSIRCGYSGPLPTVPTFIGKNLPLQPRSSMRIDGHSWYAVGLMRMYRARIGWSNMLVTGVVLSVLPVNVFEETHFDILWAKWPKFTFVDFQSCAYLGIHFTIFLFARMKTGTNYNAQS